MYTKKPYKPHTGSNTSSYSSKYGSNSFKKPFQKQGRFQRPTKRKLPVFDPTQFINKNPTPQKEAVYVPTHTFNDFAIDEQIKKTLTELNLTSPSPIQDQVIPKILEGHDVVGLAETGTGKTAAFLIPLIELKKKKHSSTTLILTPTRELALQIDVEFKKLSKSFRLFSAVCVGGVRIGGQIHQLKKMNHFIIGTPGRIKDLQQRGILPSHTIDSIVLDEADRMLDMGFIHDMQSILNKLPQKRQTLFFSATMDNKTEMLVRSFTKEPTIISVKKRDIADSIAQDVVPYVPTHKFETLVSLLKKDTFNKVIIFGSMKHSVEKLSNELSSIGIVAESIHGNKNHNQRQRSLTRFKHGHAQVLVATDVAARGIHVDHVTHVINYDLPNSFEDYVHRIGRTGRGATRGQALTFVAHN